MGTPPIHAGILIGIDWGLRRVGLSISDPTQTLSRPLEILEREGHDLELGPSDEKILDVLANRIKENDVKSLVFGVPYYHVSGDPNPHAGIFLQAGRAIGERLGVSVIFFDEGQTSERARELAPKKKRKSHRKVYCDDVAAGLLLQGFLDESAANRGSFSQKDDEGDWVSLERSASGR